MRMFIVLIFCLLAPKFSFCQDEKFFRDIFTGDLAKKPEETVSEKKYTNLFHSPEYLIDLNNDGIEQAVVIVKRDGDDWVDIFDQYKEKLFSYKFEEKGIYSTVYRIVRKRLNDKTVVLIFYYFEGETNYINFESSARIYLLTIDNKDLKSMSMFKGPSIFEEFKSYRSDYHLRNYKNAVIDLALRENRQLIVKYRGMSQVFMYAGNGKWKTFRE